MKRYLVTHDFTLYNYDDIKREMDSNGCLEYSFGSKDSRDVAIGDIVYIYFFSFNDNREGRIFVQGQVVNMGSNSIFILPIKINNSENLCVSKLKSVDNKLLLQAKRWLSEELAVYIDNIFRDSDIFSVKAFEEVINSKVSNRSIAYSEEILKESDERVPKLDTVVTNTKYRTDYKLKCEVLRNCGFRCEIDDKHFSFLNNEGVMYVEGHHLVPMSFQKSFGDINIDCRDNIICLCPNCHKMIHYGGDLVKEELLEKLFMKVKDRSFFVDNAINVDRLKKFYNLEK